MKNEILGVKIDNVSFSEAVAKIDELISRGGAFQITTPNPEFVMCAQEDSEFKRIINEASLATPDGVGILLAGEILNRPFKERVTGTDLVDALCKLSAEKGFRVFFLGGAEGVAQSAAAKLAQKYPGLIVAGAESGGKVTLESNSAVALAEKVRKAKPHLLFVAFGAPKQEKWIYRNLKRLNCVAMGVGGALDFVAGRQKRAPMFFRKLGLEWFWRLLNDPRRIVRMKVLPFFLLRVISSRFKLDEISIKL